MDSILLSAENIIHQVKYNPNRQPISYLEDAMEVINYGNGNGSAITSTTKDSYYSSLKNVSIILHHGDSLSHQTFMPTIGKVRPSCMYTYSIDAQQSDTNPSLDPSSSSSSSSSSSDCSVVIWPLTMKRHFFPIDAYVKLHQSGKVTAWEEKKPILFFRGAFTSFHSEKIVTYKYGGPRADAAIAMANFSAVDGIDFGFTGMSKRSHQEQFGIYRKGRMSMEMQLQYKYILSIEGNDVASGLKWQLASNSVVFMTKPQTVSYAMEDLLIPFVHYIPLKDDYSNVMEMIGWARANDEKCRWISDQATEYITRLWISEEAKMEHEVVMRSLGDLYQKQFGDALQQCFEKIPIVD